MSTGERRAQRSTKAGHSGAAGDRLRANRGEPAREQACAACRGRVGVRADARLPGVLFCEECWALARPPDEYEQQELGTVD